MVKYVFILIGIHANLAVYYVYSYVDLESVTA